MNRLRHRRGFTLIEIVVASAVLATISAGVLVTAWRLVGFARDETENMMADGYCHDVTWAVYSRNYDDIGDVAPWEINVDKELPRIESTDILGRKTVVRPLRRQDTFETPTCWVKVDENSEKTVKTITVVVKWQNQWGEQQHSNVVSRAKEVGRGS